MSERSGYPGLGVPHLMAPHVSLSAPAYWASPCNYAMPQSQFTGIQDSELASLHEGCGPPTPHSPSFLQRLATLHEHFVGTSSREPGAARNPPADHPPQWFESFLPAPNLPTEAALLLAGAGKSQEPSNLPAR